MASSTKFYGAMQNVGLTTVISDDHATSVSLSSSDDKDYITIDTTDGEEEILLAPDGAKVGVGVAAPDALLHVQGTAISTARPDFNADTVAIFENDNNCSIQILTKDASAVAEINMGGIGEDREGNLRYIASEQKMELGPRNASSKMGLYTSGSQRIHIDSSGNTAVGASTPKHLLHVQDGDLAIVTNSADDSAKKIVFTKSRSNTDGTAVIVQDDDSLGMIDFNGADSSGTSASNFALGARIMAKVNMPSGGNLGNGDMPTELIFMTSADGTEAPVSRLSLSHNGIAATTTDTASCMTFGRTGSSDKFEIRSSSGTEFNILGTESLRFTQSYKQVAELDGETLEVHSVSSGAAGSAGGLWVDLPNTCTSSGTGNKTIACTAHGLQIGDAVALPSGADGGSGQVYEVFKVAARGSSSEFTVDTNLTNSISSATGNTDGTKLHVKTGHGDTALEVKGNGSTTITSGHNMLFLKNEEGNERHTFTDGTYLGYAGSGSDRISLSTSTIGSFMRYSPMNLGDALTTADVAMLHVMVGVDVTTDMPCIKVHQVNTSDNPYGLEINNTGTGDSIHDDSGAKLTAAGVWTDASDALHKEEIVDIPYGLAEVLQMQPRKYKLKKTGEEDIGFISQEMEAIIPEVVFGDDAVMMSKIVDVKAKAAKLTDDGEEIDPAREEKARFNVPTGGKSLSYSHLTAVLVKAVQELTARIATLEAGD